MCIRDRDAPLQCLIFDSQYDSYRGAIVYLRVVNGTVYPLSLIHI